MGKRNRERRRQKERQRRAGHQGERASGPGWRRPQLDGELIVGAIDAAAASCAEGDERRCAELIDLLATGPPGPGGAAAVDVALAGALERRLAVAWQRGWQPADVVRAVRRERSVRHVAVVARAISAEAARYAAATVDPRWAAQLAAIEAEREPVGGRGERAATIGWVVEVMALLLTLPRLPRLLPLPGEAMARRSQRTGIDGRLLERVRALLAKAESTTFPDEADALTAIATRKDGQQKCAGRDGQKPHQLEADIGQRPPAAARLRVQQLQLLELALVHRGRNVAKQHFLLGDGIVA